MLPSLYLALSRRCRHGPNTGNLNTWQTVCIECMLRSSSKRASVSTLGIERCTHNTSDRVTRDRCQAIAHCKPAIIRPNKKWRYGQNAKNATICSGPKTQMRFTESKYSSTKKRCYIPTGVALSISCIVAQVQARLKHREPEHMANCVYRVHAPLFIQESFRQHARHGAMYTQYG